MTGGFHRINPLSRPTDIGALTLELKFPNARLLVYDRILSGSSSCASALVQSAYDSGVLLSGSIDSWLEDLEAGGVSGSCSAKLAACKIMEESLKQSGVPEEEASKKVEQIFSEVEEGLRNYIKTRETELDCENVEAEKLVNKEKQFCVDYAPIVLDLLLQQHLKQ